MATTSANSKTVAVASDTKGLNVAGIAKIKQAVDTFVKGYSSKVQGIGISYDGIHVAIRGTSSEKAIENLYKAIRSSVTQSLGKLNTFASQLDTVKEAYSNADTSNTSAQSYANDLNNKLNNK